jgi:hypothetical protein
LLELVRVGEVPHGHAEHDAGRLLKAERQLLDFVPGPPLTADRRPSARAICLMPSLEALPFTTATSASDEIFSVLMAIPCEMPGN